MRKPLHKDKRLWVAGMALLLCVGIVAYDALRMPPHIRYMKELGYATSVAELEKRCPPVPESENAAPLLKAAIIAIRELPDIDSRATLPIMGKAPEVSLEESYPSEQQQTLRDYVALNSSAIALTHEAITRKKFSMPCVLTDKDFDVLAEDDEKKKTEAEALLERYTDLSRLIACAGLDATLRNDLETLQHCLDTAMRLPLLLSEEPAPDYLLRSHWMVNIALDLLEEALYRAALQSDMLEHYQDMLNDDVYCGAEPRNRAVEFSLLQEMEFQNKKDKDLYNQSFFGTYAMSILDTIRLPNSFFMRAYPFLSRDINRFRIALFAHYEQEPEASLLTAFSSLSPFYFTLDMLLESGMGLDVIAYAATARTALAATRYRMDNGHLPDKLEELVPDYMNTVPRDPFTENTPLRYHYDNDHVVIFSVGLSELNGDHKLPNRYRARQIPFVLRKKEVEILGERNIAGTKTMQK